MKNIELGGGEFPRKPGYINVDIIKNDKVDISNIDFNKDKLPFNNDEVDNVFCSHCLEHIKNTKHFLNECHRILKKGAKANFVTPYGLWPLAQKPVHINCITDSWYDFLVKENVWRVYQYKKWSNKKIERRYKNPKKSRSIDKESNIMYNMLYNMPYELNVFLTK